jgi:Abnormal spindle-like microcephaly-assoc'd, ASPM-SPD-2-Hydin
VGTSKFKSLKGGGTYEGEVQPNGSYSLNLEGAYAPSEMAAERKMEEQVRNRTGSFFVTLCVTALCCCVVLPAFAQSVQRGPTLIPEVRHDTSPLLREVAPLLPEFTPPSTHEIENFTHPHPQWKSSGGLDPVTQKPAEGPTLETPMHNLEFEGLGQNDQFFCNCAPPDNDGAPGTTQYVQFVNLFYKVFNKSGGAVLGPLPGNSFWSGFGGLCQTTNSGDPIIRFDAAAGRWVVSQFAISINNPMLECVAVSQTSDATGAYNRYAFQFNAFPDYPKMSVWPDAYYFTFNDFNEAGTAYLQANVCAADRTNMLAGISARPMQCFPQTGNDFGMLASDLDGPTAPPAGTPNFVMELDRNGSTTQLDLFKFHVDFANPLNSTFTGPILIPVANFTPLCGNFTRTQCVPQPGTTQTLESLGDRMMYRLVYRNFGDHSALLASHSVLSNNVGGIRWYEMRNPETSITVFQQGTFQPDTQWRFMPAIAMDKNQDIAIGYTRTGPSTGQFPSLVYAGRVPTDPAGTMESEQLLKAGTASQIGLARWGDYSSMTIDPADDCTFWFTEEYIQTSGSFNWHTAIGNFVFPGCGGGSQPAVTLAPTSLAFPKTLLGTSSKPKTVKLTNSGNANLLISSIASSGDFTQTNNCPITPTPLAPAAFCTLTVTFTPTAINKRTGTITITDNAPNNPQSVPLSGVGTIVSYTPTTFNFGTVTVGTQSAAKTMTLTNTSSILTVTISTVYVGGTEKGDYVITNNGCVGNIVPLGNCSVSVAFKPTATGKRSAPLNVTYTNGGGSPATVSMTGTGQ